MVTGLPQVLTLEGSHVYSTSVKNQTDPERVVHGICAGMTAFGVKKFVLSIFYKAVIPLG